MEEEELYYLKGAVSGELQWVLFISIKIDDIDHHKIFILLKGYVTIYKQTICTAWRL